MRIFTSLKSESVRQYRCRDLRKCRGLSERVDDRQKRIPGFLQEALDSLTVGVTGAGGLGGVFVQGAVRKGIGTLVIYDGDNVEWSNLNRQFFAPSDRGKNKAVRLARNASRAGYMGKRLVAVPCFFQAAVERGLELPCDIAFCGVDNDETRVFVARRYLDRPVVFTAVGRDAGHGYVAVQEPGKACFACFRPQALQPETAVTMENGECPVDPAVIDVLGVVGMLALYALDSLVMNRPRQWNFKHIALHVMFPEVNAFVQKRQDCQLCGSTSGDGVIDEVRTQYSRLYPGVNKQTN